MRDGMVFKVNYRQQRNERNRVKQTKKDAKLHAREEAVAGRKLEAEQRSGIRLGDHEHRWSMERRALVG
jgi:hypothetical protein